jgi:hypothetical protein
MVTVYCLDACTAVGVPDIIPVDAFINNPLSGFGDITYEAIGAVPVGVIGLNDTGVFLTSIKLFTGVVVVNAVATRIVNCLPAVL